MSFGVLALIAAAGLGGPLLAIGRRGVVPVVVGELAAGVVIGRTGARWLDPTQPTVAFMADLGFAMLMFGAGMHVPIRQPGIGRGVRRGLAAAVLTGVLAVPAGVGIAELVGGRAAVYALLLASGSAAILIPALEEEQLLDDPRALTLMAQVGLVLLFALAWLAQRTGTSILIAGFAVGILVAVIGGPGRLSTQVTGIAAGFFVPLFFVVLGAKLDLRAVFEHSNTLALAALLLAGTVVIHLVSARATRQPAAAGLAATAQLGLPAGVATLGLQEHSLSPGRAGAVVLAALATVAVSAAGIPRLCRPTV